MNADGIRNDGNYEYNHLYFSLTEIVSQSTAQPTM